MIIFLDYDGVLHPDAVYLEKGRPVLRAEGELFMWAPVLVDLLVDYPNVQIVLSTSWARVLRFSRAKAWLPDLLAAKVIGSTWHSRMSLPTEMNPGGRVTWWDDATRYQQIRRYVVRAGLQNWLALDDQPTGWEECDRPNLIQTDSRTGLSDLKVQTLLARELARRSG